MRLAMKKQAGFSLIEAMMGMIVLSVGLLGLVGMFEAGYKAVDSADNHGIASRLARDKMEELRASPLRLVAVPETDHPSGMNRTWSTENVLKNGQTTKLWLINVSVQWRNIEGKARVARLKSFRSS